jgi:hypothetical protein
MQIQERFDQQLPLPHTKYLSDARHEQVPVGSRKVEFIDDIFHTVYTHVAWGSLLAGAI